MQGKKTFLTRKFSGKFSSPKISSENFGSNSPSRGNFEAQNFPGDKKKFYEEIFGSLDNTTEFSTLSQYWMMPTTWYVHTTLFSAVLTHASSHTNVAPRALANVRVRTVVLAGIMIDVFCFQSGLVT